MIRRLSNYSPITLGLEKIGIKRQDVSFVVSMNMVLNKQMSCRSFEKS